MPRETNIDNGFNFSALSEERLNTCHIDLIKIFNLAIKRSNIDFGVSIGHRSTEEQQCLYRQGRDTPGLIVTNIDGINNKSKHNSYPSTAVDIYVYVEGGKYTFDELHLCYIAGVVISCAKELYEKCQINHLIRWGNNWDMDGIIKYDQNLIDMPHFELIKP